MLIVNDHPIKEEKEEKDEDKDKDKSEDKEFDLICKWNVLQFNEKGISFSKIYR